MGEPLPFFNFDIDVILFICSDNNSCIVFITVGFIVAIVLLLICCCYIYISDFISCRGKPLQFFVFGSIEHILFDVCINSFLIIYYLLQCFVVSPCMLNMLGFCFYIVYNILDCCWYGGTLAIFYL